jgi:putative flippase GtrA
MIFKDKKELNRFLRFAVVGIIGAVVDFGIFNLLTNFTTTAPVIASVISFICAVISNFLWNRYWTYPDSRSKSVPRQMVQFIVVSGVGLVIRTPLFAFLESNLIKLAGTWVSPSIISPVFIGHNVSLAIAVLVVMIWNFFANRYWTYSDVG